MVLGEKHGTNYLPYTFSIPLSIVDLQIMLKRNASSATAELLFHF